jgi:hypothetical protein
VLEVRISAADGENPRTLWGVRARGKKESSDVTHTRGDAVQKIRRFPTRAPEDALANAFEALHFVDGDVQPAVRLTPRLGLLLPRVGNAEDAVVYLRRTRTAGQKA